MRAAPLPLAWLETNRQTGEVRVSLKPRTESPTMLRRWTSEPLSRIDPSIDAALETCLLALERIRNGSHENSFAFRISSAALISALAEKRTPSLWMRRKDGHWSPVYDQIDADFYRSRGQDVRPIYLEESV